MYILDISKLMAGDIILTRGKNIISKGVRLASVGDYSHAMLYVTEGSYIHSDKNGVHSENINRLLFKDAADVKVLRVVDNADINKACVYARSKIGTAYSVKDAVKTVFPLKVKLPSEKQFCSRLVAEAYDFSGLKLVEDPHFCTPSELNNSLLLETVENVIQVASDEQITFVNSENPLERQKEATNLILREARRLTGKKIQDFSGLVDALLADHSFDEEITRIAESSGYYDYMQYEVDKNFWRYNGPVFMLLPLENSKRISVAKRELKMANEDIARFNNQLESFNRLCAVKNINYFNREKELYKEIMTYQRQRREAAIYVLLNSGVELTDLM